VEGLRAELASREEELEQLRHNLNALSSQSSSGSLSEEMVNAFQQQHELEHSNSQSRIRALETDLFEAEDRVHSLQKQVTAQQDELTKLRSLGNSSARPMSPVRSRPNSRSDNLRRQTLAGTRRTSGLGTSQATRTLDYSMSPEMQAKRRDALRLLQARMESEKSTAPAAPTYGADGRVAPIRPQFLDETHIFWCHSCRGDLVIL
jgi:uncharacterized coiled-coil protein SlyX